MSIVLVLLSLFFILGLSLGPMLLGVAIVGLGDRRGARIATWAIGLGLKSIYRPTITFNAADELTLKKRSYDEKHDAEYVRFGGLLRSVKRYLYDPEDRIHSFYGVPFGFVDELFGVVFDPRDVVLGREGRREQANNQYEHRIERDGRLEEAVKAVFEIPRGGVGVRLSELYWMIGGSADSQALDWVRDIFETSQAPKAQTTALRQLLVPLGTLIGIIILGMFVAGQHAAGSAAPSTPTGNHSTMNIASGLLLLWLSTGPVRRIAWRDVLFGLVALGLSALVLGGLVLAFPVYVPLMGIPLPLGIWAALALLLGVVVTPVVASFFGRSLGVLGLGLGKLYIILGLLRFDRPVITFDADEYVVVEYDEKLWPVEPKWYRFAMNRVGIGLRNAEENWPDGTTLSPAQVEAMAEHSDLAGGPTGHTLTDLIAVGDIKGFVPDNASMSDVFVRTDRTTGWLAEAGQNRRLLTAALQTAKQEFGGGRKPVGDKWIMGATIVMAFMGLIFDWMVFF